MKNSILETKSNLPVILICGIGDTVWLMKLMTWHWKWFGISPHVVSVGWYDRATIYDKLDYLDNIISTYREKVSIVGISAGGSLALNYYSVYKHKVQKIVTVGSRLRSRTIKYPLARLWFYLGSKLFFESVQLLESRIQLVDPKKFLIMRAQFGDELARSRDMRIPGVEQKLIPLAGHRTSIAGALTFFCKPIIDFLKHQ